VTIFALSLTACGKPHTPTVELGEFAPYVNDFTTQARAAGLDVEVTDLRVVFGSTDSPYQRGLCDITPDQTPTIIIQEWSWKEATEAAREELMFHELGHCVLHRKHHNDKTDNGFAKSIMNAYLLDSDTYEEFREYYLQELFSSIDEF